MAKLRTWLLVIVVVVSAMYPVKASPRIVLHTSANLSLSAAAKTAKSGRRWAELGGRIEVKPACFENSISFVRLNQREPGSVDSQSPSSRALRNLLCSLRV